MHQFKDSCNYPDQLALIEESLRNPATALDIAGRLGIPIESYYEVCNSAIEHNANMKQRQEQRYYYREIGAATGGAKKTDMNARQRNTQVKYKAIL